MGFQEILNYPPLYISIGITGYCINACQFCSSHCPDSGKNEITKHQYNIPFNMSYKQFRKIVDMAYKARVPHVHIVGVGEPFLNKDIFKMIDYLALKYCKLSTQTNFNKRLFEEQNLLDKILERKNSIISITSDVFPPKIHNLIKKGSNYTYLMDSMEYISQNSRIEFDLHTILTKKTYRNLDKIIFDLVKRDIKFKYTLVNLHPHNFNEFTSAENCYYTEDKMITKELEKLRRISKRLNVPINIPYPWDQVYKEQKGNCYGFWGRFQVMPDRNIPKEKWVGNVIPSQCNAVVVGNLSTLGNILDYDDLFDIWNNNYFRIIRRNLRKGIYPDDACKTCYKYSNEIN